MSTLTLYEGRLRGDTGQDGENGTGVSDIRQSIVDNPLLDILRNNKPEKTGNSLALDRDSEALVTDRYGVNQWIPGDTITNYITESNDFSAWSDTNTNWQINSTNNTDPFGGNTATEIELTADTIPFNVMGLSVESLISGGWYRLSFYIKLISGNSPSVNIKYGLNYDVTETITANYQRVEVQLYGINSITDLFISPQGLSGSKLHIFGVMLQRGRVTTDYLATTGSAVSIPNPSSSYRANELGYLLEGAKENLITWSEDLTGSTWSLSSGTVGTYSGQDPFNDNGKNIQVSFGDDEVLTISATGTFLSGQAYTVSFWGLSLSGTIDSVTASLSGSSVVNVDAIPTDEFKRISVNVIAGASGDLEVNITSITKDAVFAFTGFQVEEDNITSYIATNIATLSRDYDNLSIPWFDNAPLISGEWSLFFAHNSIIINSENKYILHNGLSGADEFYVRAKNSDIQLRINNQTKTYSILSSSDVFLTFNGTDIKAYNNGDLFNSSTISTFTAALPNTLYIGTDNNGMNSTNAYLSSIQFWQEELTSNEVKYISDKAES
tara:strand:+ start:348 stop:2006 length:1659 start_codon:yes stop_codon:yes gene_type:complete